MTHRSTGNAFVNKATLIIICFAIIVQYYCYRVVGFIIPEIAQNLLSHTSMSDSLNTIFKIFTFAGLIKPLFSWVFAKLSDIHGAKISILTGMFVVGCSTACIGLLPSNKVCNLLVLFTFLFTARMLITSFVTVTIDSAKVFIFSAVELKMKSVMEGITHTARIIGGIFASIAAYLLSLEMMPQYSWRIICILGFFFNIVLFVIFYRCSTQCKLTHHDKCDQYTDIGIFALLGMHWKLFLCSACIIGCAVGGLFQFINIFLYNYVTLILKITDMDHLRFIHPFSLLSYMCFTILSSTIINYVGIKKSITVSVVLTFLAGLALVHMLCAKIFYAVSFILLQSVAGYIAPVGTFIVKSYCPRSIRYRLFAAGHSIGSIVFSVPVAFFCMQIYHVYKTALSPCVFLLFMVIVMFWSMYYTVYNYAYDQT